MNIFLIGAILGAIITASTLLSKSRCNFGNPNTKIYASSKLNLKEKSDVYIKTTLNKIKKEK